MNHANELQRITDECEKHGTVASMILGDAPRTRILREKHRITLRIKEEWRSSYLASWREVKQAELLYLLKHNKSCQHGNLNLHPFRHLTRGIIIVVFGFVILIKMVYKLSMSQLVSRALTLKAVNKLNIWAETGHKPLKLSQGQLEERRESQSDRWKLGKELLECKRWAPRMVLPHQFFYNGSANAGYWLGRKKKHMLLFCLISRA